MIWFNGKARILNHQGPTYNLGTDASKTGFGGICELGHMWGVWAGPGGRCIHEEKPPTELYDDHINEEELWPVLVGLKRWGDTFRNSIVYVTTDNTGVGGAEYWPQPECHSNGLGKGIVLVLLFL